MTSLNANRSIVQPGRDASSSPRVSLPHDENIDLGRMIGLLMDNKWKIFFLTLLFGLGGAVYSLLATPLYQGDALVQVENTGTRTGADQIAAMLLQEEPRTAAQREILSSRMIMGRAAMRQKLDISVSPETLPVIGGAIIRHHIPRPEFALGRPEIWGGESVFIDSLAVESELLNLPLTLEVTEGGGYRLLGLEEEVLLTGRPGERVMSHDPWIEIRVSELLAPPGARFTVVKRSEQSAIRYLRNRFNVLQRGEGDSGMLQLVLTGTDRAEVESSLNAIAEVYLSQNIARQAAEAENSLEFLDQQLPSVQEQLVQAENHLNAYRMEHESVDLTQETQNVLSSVLDIESRLNDLEMQEKELARRFTPNHPVYAALLAQKAQLQRERANLDERTSSLPETQQQVLRMTRDVEVTQQIYVQLLNRMQELNIAKAATVGNVRIIDFAVVAPGQIKPRSALIVIVAMMVGLLLTVCIILLRNILNKGVENAEQLEDLGLPVYATVPRSDDQMKLVKRIKHRKDKISKHAIGSFLARRYPTDMAIESIRGLRTSLHFAMMDAPNNAIMITGPSPGIGKSFLSANLAYVCAQGGQRVLIIDADMRKGNLHHIFSDEAQGGLSEAISGQISLEDAIHISDVPHLDYMTRGMAPPNPTELLMGQSFANLIERACADYDLVLIDTPPILAVTDASLIGKLVGTTLLVARFGVNPLREIKIATRRLENTGIPVKGYILNAIEKTAAISYGYGYYSYSYK
ncbi:polysaccharide biosynthesis tyrosine autokinase [Billgrantia endophytica]|uniref:Tyrosine-protein kinase n=1 Tax=Billgrantia endophytica TaxID=2033802 RepID=A0A2N7U973_9GAMM|nr:polysaccharide biosynthesis tyrosine autokinase [Halomonas endophytica]PMR76975.1 tyrosine-protein kinase [Halomonas endophytica]